MTRMTMALLGVALLGSASLLGACTLDGLLAQPAAVSQAEADAAAMTDAEAVLAKADWARALSPRLRVRQNEFEPVVLVLRKGTPYILRLENGDDRAHSFRAPTFFKAIVVKSLVPAEEGDAPPTALEAIVLAPHQTRELAFVPRHDGSFPFSDGWVGLLLGGALGSRGLITID